ncbi:MAG: P-II family nitrogen regulator [Nitrospirae bacterium]|nr:P-II family nitrogen regulator [Nitrospirota bacterium]
MKHVVAIIRSVALDRVVEGLQSKNIKGMSINEVKGTGEQFALYKPFTSHVRIDLFVSDEKIKDVKDIFLALAKTGEPGDGLIAICPVDEVLKIRTGGVLGHN